MPGEVEREIGRHVAALIPDGATLQAGIGKIPEAVLAALIDRKDLGAVGSPRRVRLPRTL